MDGLQVVHSIIGESSEIAKVNGGMFNEQIVREKKEVRATCEQVSETCERLCESKMSTGKGQIESSVDG